MAASILNIGTATPEYRIDQQTILEFMQQSIGEDESLKRKLKVLYRASGIQQRHSVIKDYGTVVEEYEFYPSNKSLNPFPTTSQRMDLYKKHALNLSLAAIADANIPKETLDKTTHLVAISCTGLIAPGLDITIAQTLGFKNLKQRFGLNFMGCYAALNGLKMAQSICESDKKASVLIVSVELCTLHFQQGKTDDIVLANSLFSDGAAAVIIQNISQKEPKVKTNFKIKKGFSELVQEGIEDMAWAVGDFGFEMKLSSYVPKILDNNLAPIFKKHIGESFNPQAYTWAVHPGGKRILDNLKLKYDLTAEQINSSYEVLHDFGNMSSATVLFVLKNILSKIEKDDSEILKNKEVMMLAFGPGLTVEGLLLEIF